MPNGLVLPSATFVPTTTNAGPMEAERRPSMAKLSEKKRDSLKSSQFGLPDERKYPMPDASHARNAKARAAQQEEKGNLTKSEERKIDRKADGILDK
jgi:hypothetical protein